MKYMNFKTVTLLLSAFALIAFSGCDKEGIPSDKQLVGSGTPPVAVATVDPSTVTIGDTVVADGSGSYDEDGQIVSYVWKFQDLIIGEGVTVDASTASFAAGTYTITLQVTDNDGNTATDTVEVTLEEPAGPTCLETAGYGIITLANGQIWLDKNLGASKVADNRTDTGAYGDLFQWGRAADGHEKRNSQTTAVKAGSIVPNHDQFITTTNGESESESESDSSTDWVDFGIDDNGSDRYIGWKSVNSATQVCPCGYIVPSASDFAKVDDNLSMVAVKLNLTLAGWRESDIDGTLHDSGEFGPYWTRDVSNVSETQSKSLYYGFSLEEDDGIIFEVPERMYGLPVRCINPATTSDEEYTPELD